MIFSDSVTQQFSEPRSIGFKGPIPSFKSLPFGQGLLFSHTALLFLFCCFQLFIKPKSMPAVPSSFFCTSAWFEFSFLSSSA